MTENRTAVLQHYTGISAEEFNREYRGKKPFVSERRADRLPGLLGWPDVNELLDLSLLLGEKIHLVKEDLRIDRRLFTVDLNKDLSRVHPASVRRAVDEGHSILLDRIDSYYRPARDLADSFMNILGEEAGINAYISWKTDKCFNTHWDDHDVFIFQTAGEKEWSIFEPTRQGPMEPDVEYDRPHRTKQDDLKLWWQGKVLPGMVLYIPRGWWHHAKSTGAGSIHLTLGFYNRTGVDFVRYLAARAAEEEWLRRDLVRREVPDLFEAEKENLRSNMIKYLDEVLAGGGLDHFWRNHFASMSPRFQSNLPMSLSLDDFTSRNEALRIASLAPIVPIAKGEQHCVIEIAGRRFDLALEAYEVLRLFADGQARRSKDVAALRLSGLSTEQTEALMFELLNEGILAVASSSLSLAHPLVAAE